MKKVKYYYNTQSLRYEKYEVPARTRLLRAVGFISATLVFAFIIVALAYTYLDSPKEKALRREISELQLQYDNLNEQLDQMQTVLYDLQDRDDNMYRVIFEAEPIPSSVRLAGSGGVNKYRELMDYDNSELMVSTSQKLDQVRKELFAGAGFALNKHGRVRAGDVQCHFDRSMDRGCLADDLAAALMQLAFQPHDFGRVQQRRHPR